MSAACFRKALNQRIGTSVKKNEFCPNTLGIECCELSWEDSDAVAAAHIDRYRNMQMADQIDKQGCRQVIDTVITGVFQDIERNGLPRTGQSADDDDLHGSEYNKESGPEIPVAVMM